jgi:hypothetical protein
MLSVVLNHRRDCGYWNSTPPVFEKISDKHNVQGMSENVTTMVLEFTTSVFKKHNTMVISDKHNVQGMSENVTTIVLEFTTSGVQKT